MRRRRERDERGRPNARFVAEGGQRCMMAIILSAPVTVAPAGSRQETTSSWTPLLCGVGSSASQSII